MEISSLDPCYYYQSSQELFFVLRNDQVMDTFGCLQSPYWNHMVVLVNFFRIFLFVVFFLFVVSSLDV